MALLMAFAAVALHAAVSGESGAQASGGMAAFGDLVLFAAVFGVVALVPTGAAFFFIFSRRNGPGQSPEPSAPGDRGPP